MQKQQHIIYSNSVELEFYNQKENLFIQNHIADLVKHRLLPAMETLFDEQTASGKKIKIDSLEINLGVINNNDWENLFVNECIYKLRQKLREVIAFESGEEVYEVSYKEDRVHINNIHTIDECINNLGSFLQSGVLPWNVTHITAGNLLHEVLESARNDTLTLAQKEKLLRHIFYSEMTLERFIIQFDDAALLYFFENILKLANAEKAFISYRKFFSESANTSLMKITGHKKILNEIFINRETNIAAKTVTGRTREDPHQLKKTDAAYFIDNAGLVILSPFLKQMFTNLNLCGKKQFKSERKQMRAVLLSQYLVTGETKIAEHELPLNKILCGFPLNKTLPAEFVASEEEIKQCSELLQSALEYWKELKTTNVEALLNTYIIRNGKLVDKNEYWLLQVEYKAYDVMLQFMPWSISIIYLPWMQKRLMVEWHA